MIILFLVFIFLDQLVFKNDRRVGERKKPGKAEKHKKVKNRKNVRWPADCIDWTMNVVNECC